MSLVVVLSAPACVHGSGARAPDGPKGVGVASGAGPRIAARARPVGKPALVETVSEVLTVESDVGKCKLGATVVRPKDGTAKALVAIIHGHGSGPLDRDGKIPGGYHPYKDLGQSLVAPIVSERIAAWLDRILMPVEA